MNIFTKVKKLVIALGFFLMLGGAQLFAQSQDDLSRVYGEIDAAFSEKSIDKLSAILKDNTNKYYYTYYEAYTLKKTRQLIIEDDLEFARQASLAVIDNNIENFDAVDLYSYIDKAILNEMAYKQAQENRRRLEAERLAAAQQKTREKIENRGTYQTVSTASGKSVYMTESKQTFSTLDWNVKIGLADLMFQTITTPAQYDSTKYGLLFGADMFYETEQFIFGFDLDADVLMLTMGKGEQEFFSSGRLVPEIALAGMSKNLFLRFGFGAYGVASEKKSVTGSVGTMLTPIIGVGIDNLSFNEFRLAAHYDFYPGCYAYDGLSAAMEFGTQLLIPLAVNERNKIGIELGVSDVLYMKDDGGMDNRVKAIFAIGVGNVTK